MSEIERLNQQFRADGAVRFEEGPGGLTRAWIDTTQGQSEIYLQGAHLTRWQPATAVHPVLFLSSRSFFASGKAIRGGVPVVFPWFGERQDGLPGPQHGFARSMPWEVVAAERHGSDAGGMTLRLLPNQTTRDLGFDPFVATLEVISGPTLEVRLSVENLGDEQMVIGDALHAYFTVSDVHQVEVTGLAGTDYIDKADGAKQKHQDAQAIRFRGETDQLHLNTTAPVTIHDPGWNRRIVIEKEGSNSTVVWNPWQEKAAKLADLGDVWPGFVCVEPANARENAVTIEPGAVHTLVMRVRVEPFADRS